MTAREHAQEVNGNGNLGTPLNPSRRLHHEEEHIEKALFLNSRSYTSNAS
jgi:hypothetical protein